MDNLIWLDTEGGPCLLVPAELADAWEGVFGPTDGRIVMAKARYSGQVSPEGPATDYDMACDVEEYAGLVPVGNGQGIVLGAEPASTAIWQISDEGIFILRWLYADSGAAEAVLPLLPDLTFEAENLFLECHVGRIFLFDATASGANSLEERTEVQVIPGRYALGSLHYRPDDKTYFLLHRLQRVHE